MASGGNHSAMSAGTVRDRSYDGITPSTRVTLRAIGLRAISWCHQSFDLPSDGRILPIEGLRALAILLVFFVHYDALFSTLAPRHSLTLGLSRFTSAVGNAGVDLFFVISGYLIYGAVLRRKIQLMHFLRRRAERIYPTFLCVFALHVAAVLIFSDPRAIGRQSPGDFFTYVLENILLLPGIFPIVPIIPIAWSLSYEFFFYIVAPILVIALGMRAWTRAQRVIFFAGLAMLHALLFVIDALGLIRLAMFLVGILLYECISSRVMEGRLKAAGEIVTIAAFCVALIAGGWLISHSSGVQVVGRSGYYYPFYRVAILSVTIFAFVLFSLIFDGLLKRFFSQTLVRWLGNISYSYYLIHGGALHVFRLLLYAMWSSAQKSAIWCWLLLPISVAVTVVATIPLFLLVEKRFSLKPQPEKTAA